MQQYLASNCMFFCIGIFFCNIMSINEKLFFNTNQFSFLRVVFSLVNLDLGYDSLMRCLKSLKLDCNLCSLCIFDYLSCFLFSLEMLFSSQKILIISNCSSSCYTHFIILLKTALYNCQCIFIHED